ncbi:MAG TPA: hypothetical protein VI365_16390, partial [Trebonia sp.]
MTPVEQPEDKAGRPRYGNEQRIQRERAADDLRLEPATALRHEPVANRHERSQHPQPVTITGEYSTGLIRTTFTAVPARRPGMAAKACVITAVMTAYGGAAVGA